MSVQGNSHKRESSRTTICGSRHGENRCLADTCNPTSISGAINDGMPDRIAQLVKARFSNFLADTGKTVFAWRDPFTHGAILQAEQMFRWT